MKYSLKLIVLFILTIGYSLAQTKELPLYEKVIHGKLKNGITYYILPNKEPENRAEMYLAVNAGSILEDDDQLGLAHFVEHMAFNGSKHFKKNELVEFLQSVGVRFGADLNAYTSFDETVYMIHIPTDNPEAVKKGFLVLEDWAHSLTFDPEEVEKERNVVIEEWRLSQGGIDRVRRKIMKKILQNSRYEKRFPIGKPEIIKTAPPETLVRFYKDWYRPDLIAVIIVGDIDPKLAEKKIKKHFAKIKMPKNPRERKFYEVPDNKGTIVAIGTDKEFPSTDISLGIKQPKRVIKTEEDYKKVLIDQLISMIMEERYEPYTEDPKYSFNGGSVGYSSMVRTRDEFSISISPNEKNLKKAFEIGLGEAVRAYQNGFLKSELERAKRKLLRKYEEKYKEKDKTKSNRLVWNLVRNYLDNSPFPGPEYDYNFAKKALNEITVEDVNKQYKSYWNKDNRVLVLTGTEKEGVKFPTEEELLQWMNEVENKKYEQIKETTVSQNLIDEKLTPALKIISEKKLDDVGVTKIEFSNGLTAYLKPTKFKEDEVRIEMFSEGGRSLLDPKYDEEAVVLGEVLPNMGVKNLSASELDKVLAGKKVSVNLYVDDYSEGASGKTSPQDLETFFQLLYLYIKHPRYDENAFKSTLMQKKMMLSNLLKMPQMYFFYYFPKDFYNHNPRVISSMEPEVFEKANLEELKEVHKQRFNNIGDFNIVLVGNFDKEKAVELISKYLGNLPTNNQKEHYKNNLAKPVSGKVKHKINKGTANKSFTIMVFHKKMDLPLKKRMLFSIFNSILSMRLTKKVREENSLVYSISSFPNVRKIPEDYMGLGVFFPSAPENIDKIVELVQEQVNDLITNGATSEELEKARKQILNDFIENKTNNKNWLNLIESYVQYNEPLSNINKREKIVKNATWEDVKNAAKELLENTNYYELRLYPEKSE